MKNKSGFTLIEMLIVVAIIAILAAIALPAYQDYIIRSQVSEGMVLADGAKTSVTEFYVNRGNWPTENTSAGLASASSITGSYVTSVTVAGSPSVITVAYGNKANSNLVGGTVALQGSAVTDGGSIQWSCSSSTIPAKYLPTSCR